jgi:enoyl-CoA hydratase/carnithine racemase
MLKAVMENLLVARNDPECKVIIFTGVGSYYCAGVNLAGVLKPMVRAQHSTAACVLVNLLVNLLSTLLSRHL